MCARGRGESDEDWYSCSGLSHCVVELLHRYDSNELSCCEITVCVSNHEHKEDDHENEILITTENEPINNENDLLLSSSNGAIANKSSSITNLPLTENDELSSSEEKMSPLLEKNNFTMSSLLENDASIMSPLLMKENNSMSSLNENGEQDKSETYEYYSNNPFKH